MHNFDVPHASKTVNHAPTQSEVHQAYVLHMMVPFPPLHRILYAPAVIYVQPKRILIDGEIN